MSNELEAINTNMDIYPILSPSDRHIFMQIDEIIDNAILTGDMSLIWSFGKSLRKSIQISGLALAKLLYRLYQSWETLTKVSSIYDDTFVDIVYSELGISPVTTTKYITMWDAIFKNESIPEKIRNQLMNQPIQSLLLLTAAARENFNEIDWNEVVKTTTPAEMRRFVRNIRGNVTSSNNAMYISINMRTGELIVRKGEESAIIGFLLVTAMDNPLIQAAIQRLIRVGEIGEI